MAELTIALAGNPNAGKTTIFNALTGLHQHTGNWPGKTVEKKEGEIEHKVVENEKIEREDFIIKQIPELSSAGIRREILAPLEHIDWKIQTEQLSIKFSLLKGDYATCLMREIMKAPIIEY